MLNFIDKLQKVVTLKCIKPFNLVTFKSSKQFLCPEKLKKRCSNLLSNPTGAGGFMVPGDGKIQKTTKNFRTTFEKFKIYQKFAKTRNI